ncbi:MAG TPA: glycosyltransferase family 4 protein [Flavobacteriales bacterium]|nr:glycosyltransferase family 4 protein [Flavobacteriales bacterium]
MSRKPQVLVFIDWYKPFFKAGGPVRSMVNLVDHLHDLVDFHIVTGDRDYTANASPGDLPKDQWIERDQGERVWYASPSQRTLKQWRVLLKERDWDAVYINGLYSKWSTIAPLWLLRGSKQRRIVAVRGMLAKGPMKQSAAKKRAFLLAMKTTGCYKGVEFQATNNEEVEDIKRWIGPKSKVHLVPNLGRKLEAKEPVAIDKKPGELRLVSVGRIAPEKNTLFAIERLCKAEGDIRFDLYGTVYDQAYWKRCQDAIAQLPKNVKVVWHDHIGEDHVRGVIEQAHAVFMPSVGENFGHTMLEALVAGRPLLISDRTPWKGLEEKGAGWDLPLEAPERFERVVAQLLALDQTGYYAWLQGATALGQRYLADTSSLERSLALFSR